MTMLDRMRRHKGWLKWSLALVVLTFIVFYIPDFLGQNATTTVGAAPREVIAEVDGRDLTAGDFQSRYQSQLQAYQQQFGGNLNQQLLRQLGIDQQINGRGRSGRMYGQASTTPTSSTSMRPIPLPEPDTSAPHSLHASELHPAGQSAARPVRADNLPQPPARAFEVK